MTEDFNQPISESEILNINCSLMEMSEASSLGSNLFKDDFFFDDGHWNCDHGCYENTCVCQIGTTDNDILENLENLRNRVVYFESLYKILKKRWKKDRMKEEVEQNAHERAITKFTTSTFATSEKDPICFFYCFISQDTSNCQVYAGSLNHYAIEKLMKTEFPNFENGKIAHNKNLLLFKLGGDSRDSKQALGADNEELLHQEIIDINRNLKVLKEFMQNNITTFTDSGRTINNDFATAIQKIENSAQNCNNYDSAKNLNQLLITAIVFHFTKICIFDLCNIHDELSSNVQERLNNTIEDHNFNVSCLWGIIFDDILEPGNLKISFNCNHPKIDDRSLIKNYELSSVDSDYLCPEVFNSTSLSTNLLDSWGIHENRFTEVQATAQQSKNLKRPFCENSIEKTYSQQFFDLDSIILETKSCPTDVNIAIKVFPSLKKRKTTEKEAEEHILNHGSKFSTPVARLTGKASSNYDKVSPAGSIMYGISRNIHIVQQDDSSALNVQHIEELRSSVKVSRKEKPSGKIRKTEIEKESFPNNRQGNLIPNSPQNFLHIPDKRRVIKKPIKPINLAPTTNNRIKNTPSNFNKYDSDIENEFIGSEEIICDDLNKKYITVDMQEVRIYQKEPIPKTKVHSLATVRVKKHFENPNDSKIAKDERYEKKLEQLNKMYDFPESDQPKQTPGIESRYISPCCAVDKKVTYRKTSNKKIDNKAKKWLCPYCDDFKILPLGDSSYLHHLQQIHGINKVGEYFPDPINHRNYEWFNCNNQLRIREGVTCTTCNKILLLKNSSKENSKKPEDHRLKVYLRHYEKNHCNKTS